MMGRFKNISRRLAMNEALVANYNESAQWKVQVQRISLYIYALKNLT
jgi:hypothetical protein